MDSEKDRSFDQLQQITKELDQQLSQLDSRELSPGIGVGRFSWKKMLLKLTVICIGLVLPFMILIRTSVFMYQQYQLNAWGALVLGCFATVFLLVFYVVFFIHRYGIGKSVMKFIVRGILVLVLAYTFYGMMYYSSLNTKTEQIQSHYRSLHPIMRVALTTITLTNSDLVVTDIQRNPQDYNRMELPENKQSLHYVQPTGYVHAVDLRTKDRAAWKNWVLRLSFDLVGLSTLRHSGTADHLHVYLPLNQ